MARRLDVLDQIRGIMDAGGIDPTPRNYDLCHRYVTHSDHRVWLAIDAEFRTHNRLTADALAKIVSDRANDEEPGSAQFLGRVEEKLSLVARYLDGAKDDAAAYGGRLQAGRESLEPGAGGDARSLLAELAAATDLMIDQTKKLSSQLDSSSRELDEMRAALDKAKRDTVRDALTALPNRKAFDAQFADEVEKAAQSRTPMCVAFCDVDHFKRFNDNWGHRVGDDVLRFIGVKMIEMFKDAGFAARYGGEEFVVILPRHRVPQACELVEAFRASVSARLLRMRGDGREIGRVTVSAGIAQLRHGETGESLIERADGALYRAKGNGRNRVEVDD